jgi:RNA polymerase sigma factor (sigma-70 family)
MVSDYGIASIETNTAAEKAGSKSQLDRLDENALVAVAKQNQTAAFDEIWQSHAKKVLRTAYRITKNREDAEDAVQDAFLRAYLHLNDFGGRSSFSTWLTRIAINSALMILRKKRSALEFSLDDSNGELGFPDVSDRASDPEAHCVRQEQEMILRDALSELRPSIRQVIELQKLQERSLEETAKMLGLSVSAAKSKLHHGKVALRKSSKLEAIRPARTTRRFRYLPAA